MLAKMAANGIDSNPCPHQPETYSGMEVAAILKRRTALTTQPLQLCVDSGMLIYKNVASFLTDISASFLQL